MKYVLCVKLENGIKIYSFIFYFARLYILSSGRRVAFRPIELSRSYPDRPAPRQSPLTNGPRPLYILLIHLIVTKIVCKNNNV
jgi:hypothetical protein